nr:hypothetical protein CE91St29_13620 [Corynebacterium striatum]
MSAPAITRPLRAGVKEICDMKLSLWEVVDVQSVGNVFALCHLGQPINNKRTKRDEPKPRPHG